MGSNMVSTQWKIVFYDKWMEYSRKFKLATDITLHVVLREQDFSEYLFVARSS